MTENIVNFKQGKNQLTYKDTLAVLDKLLLAFDRTHDLPDLELCELFCPLVIGADEVYKEVAMCVKINLSEAIKIYQELKQSIIDEPESFVTHAGLIAVIDSDAFPLASAMTPKGLKLCTPLDDAFMTTQLKTILRQDKTELFISDVYMNFESLWLNSIKAVFKNNRLPDEGPESLFYDPFQNRMKAKHARVDTGWGGDLI